MIYFTSTKPSRSIHVLADFILWVCLLPGPLLVCRRSQRYSPLRFIYFRAHTSVKRDWGEDSPAAVALAWKPGICTGMLSPLKSPCLPLWFNSRSAPTSDSPADGASTQCGHSWAHTNKRLLRLRWTFCPHRLIQTCPRLSFLTLLHSLSNHNNSGLCGSLRSFSNISWGLRASERIN